MPETPTKLDDRFNCLSNVCFPGTKLYQSATSSTGCQTVRQSVTGGGTSRLADKKRLAISCFVEGQSCPCAMSLTLVGWSIAVFNPLAIDLPGFADGWGGYRVVHYDQSTDPKLNFHIGRRHTSRTTSRTCRFGPETPFQAATHPENLETQNTLYRLQQRVCWSMGSLGSGPQPGSSCGSRRQRRRGCL